MGLLDGAGKNITDGFAKAREKAEDAGEFVVDKTGDAAEFLGDKAQDAGEFIKDKAGDVGEFVKDKAEDAGELVEDAIERIKGERKSDAVMDDEDPAEGAKGGSGV